MRSQMDFFELWQALMEATKEPDEDAFGELCCRIFSKTYPDGAKAEKVFQGELAKIKDQRVKTTVKDATEILMDAMKYFYFTAGFAVAQDYDVSTPGARRQIDFLRKRIHDSGIFPMTAKLKATHGKRPGGN